MVKNDLVQLKEWFSEYVAGYYTGDEQYDLPIRLKEDHTQKVCENILVICRGLHLPETDHILAEIIALFHDLGRFEQYARYGTFNDMASDNHARIGLREMGKHGVLTRFNKGEKRLISKAVAYHNTPSLGENHSERDRLFMRLIRDADKLDIWRVLMDYYGDRGERPNPVIDMGLPDIADCSQEIINAFSMSKPALLKNVKTIFDLILLQISWVYDLNFVESFQMVRQQKVVERLNEFLPELPAARRAVEAAQHYVEKHLSRDNPDITWNDNMFIQSGKPCSLSQGLVL